MADEKKIPTWGFHPVEPDRIFHLKPGETLPEGWSDKPVPKRGTAEGATLGGAPGAGSAALEAATARIRELEQIIETGRAENRELREELKGADEEAEAAAAQVKTLSDQVAVLKARVEQLQAENEQLRAGHAAQSKAGKGK